MPREAQDPGVDAPRVDSVDAESRGTKESADGKAEAESEEGPEAETAEEPYLEDWPDQPFQEAEQIIREEWLAGADLQVSPEAARAADDNNNRPIQHNHEAAAHSRETVPVQVGGASSSSGPALAERAPRATRNDEQMKATPDQFPNRDMDI